MNLNPILLKKTMSEKYVVLCFFNNVQDEMTLSIQKLMQCKSKTRKARKKLLNVNVINPSNISFLITQFGIKVFSRSMTIDSIIELFYFCSKLAEKCEKMKCDNYIPLIVKSLLNFLSTNLDMWIKDNNVWENIVILANNLPEKRKNNIWSQLILLLL